MKWELVSADTTQDKMKAVAMMPIGNKLVSVAHDDETYTVECLSLQGDCGPAKWFQVGKRPTHGRSVASITNIGKKVLILWRPDGKQFFSVECFNMNRGNSFLLPDVLPLTSTLVTFKHGDEAFILQENGSLWKISAHQEEPYVTLKFELCLWHSQREISGAILYDGRLLVFGSGIESTTPAELSPYSTRVEQHIGPDVIRVNCRSLWTLPSSTVQLPCLQ